MQVGRVLAPRRMWSPHRNAVRTGPAGPNPSIRFGRSATIPVAVPLAGSCCVCGGGTCPNHRKAFAPVRLGFKFGILGVVPFDDEAFAQTVDVVGYRPAWVEEGETLIVVLRGLVPDADAIDHIGSTAVPGLPAKDCLDAMVRVESADGHDLGALADAGYRERPEPPRSVWRADSLEGSFSWHVPRSTPRSCVSARCGW